MLVKQTTQLTILPEIRQVKGKTRIEYSVTPGSKHIKLFAKQIQVNSVHLEGPVPMEFTYLSEQEQPKLLQTALQDTTQSLDFIQMKYTIWTHETENGGYLSITLPELSTQTSLTLHIEYVLDNPAVGIRMYSSKGSHIVHSESLPEGVRLWMPCNDLLTSKYPLDLELHVPLGYTAVASGQLIGLTEHQTMTVFHYEIRDVFIDVIGFCVAQFNTILAESKNSDLTYFSLSSRSELQDTVNAAKSSVVSILQYLSTEIGQGFPFGWYNIVFLPMVHHSHSFAGLSIIDAKHLIKKKLYETSYKTTEELVATACFNWFGAARRCNTWADYWIIKALPQYLKRNFIRTLDPNTFYVKFQVRKAIKKYCALHKKGLEARPLCSMLFSSPNDLEFDRVYRLKSGLIFHMIESIIGPGHCSRAIKGLFVNCATHSIINNIKSICTIQFKDFAACWIYGMGSIQLKCTIKDNREINKLEVAIQQVPLIQDYLTSPVNVQFKHLEEANYEIPLRLNTMRFYRGPLKIYIYETDGHEIESSQFVADLEGERYFTQISYKKNLRKLGVSRRKEDPTEDRPKPLESTFLWVRIDPDFELIREIEVTQPESHWIEQLKKENSDPISQIDAIKGVRSSHDYTHILPMLEEILHSEKHHYKVRIAAAKGLSIMSFSINAYKGLDYLVYFFKKRHYENDVLLSNDFSDLSEYFIDKAVVRYIIRVQDMSLTFQYNRLKANSSFTVEFLADLIKRNENSLNTIDDSYWLANLLQTIANTTNPVYVQDILQEINRSLEVDLVLASPHYVMAKACLCGYIALAKNHKLDLSHIFEGLLGKFQCYSPHIQSILLNSYIEYSIVMKIPLGSTLEFLLSQILTAHSHLSYYSSVIWNLLLKLAAKPELIEQFRKEKILLNLWKVCTSPLASIHPAFSAAFFDLYKFLVPIHWTDKLDPEWEWKSEEFEVGAGHRVQPIDIAQGAWPDWAREILRRLNNHEYSTPFLAPVDYQAEGLQDYPQIVMNPMDFGTVNLKMSEEVYANFYEFAEDVQLIFSNCKLYNQEGSDLFMWAVTLEEFFKVLARPIENILTAVENPDLKVTLSLAM